MRNENAKKGNRNQWNLNISTRDPRRTSIGILRPQNPPQDFTQVSNKNDSFNKSRLILLSVQLSHLPAKMSKRLKPLSYCFTKRMKDIIM